MEFLGLQHARVSVVQAIRFLIFSIYVLPKLIYFIIVNKIYYRAHFLRVLCENFSVLLNFVLPHFVEF